MTYDKYTTLTKDQNMDPSRIVKWFPDALNTDAFGRLRTSSPQTVFNSIFAVDKEPGKWSEALTNSSSTFRLNQACVEMGVTSSSGSKVYRETKRSIYYLPGMSKQTFQTFVFAPAKTNLRQRIGQFNEQNGIFFEQKNETKYLVIRSNTTGSATDNAIAQSNWNMDKLDGTGLSGVTLDTTRSQIFFTDLQWLGVGRVRAGFVIDGSPIVAHEFRHANNIVGVYSQTAKFHLRAEIENLGDTSATSSMQHICSSVILEGDASSSLVGTQRSYSTGSTSRTANSGVRFPIISIRSDPTTEVTVKPLNYDIFASSSDNLWYEIVLNGTLSSASWTADSGSYCQKDTSAVAVTGGSVVASGYIKAGAPSITQAITDQLTFLHKDINNVSDTLTVAATPIGVGNATIYGALTFQEIY